MHEHEKQIPIWFFIGALLAVYGAIICAYGLITWASPSPAKMPEQIYKLHAPVWWGFLLAALGTFYVIKYWPSKPESLTGKLEEPEVSSGSRLRKVPRH